jgi:cytochrome P450
VFTLLVAGSITTAYLIGNAAMTLATYPALLTQLRDDPHLVGALVEETLRHEAPCS